MALCRQNVVRSRVIHGALRTLVALAAPVLAGSAAGAQQLPAADQHRWATALTLDLGSLPGDFDTRCGSSSKKSEPSFGGGLGVFFRPRRWVVATLDARVSDASYGSGRKAIIPPPIATDGY